jgi:hypothetical protein
MADLGVKLGTIMGHLWTAVRSNRPLRSDNLLELSQLSPDVQQHVLNAFAELGIDYLRPIYDAMGETVSYDELKILRLHFVLQRQQTSSSSGQPLTETQQVILACVQLIPEELPRSGVAKLLVGSPSQRVAGYTEHPDYGRLSNLPRYTVMEEIDVLIMQNKLIQGEDGKLSLPETKQSSNQDENLVQRLVILGESGNKKNTPELIAALQHENGNVRRLAASALGKLRDKSAVLPLLNLLEIEDKPQVRQYVVKALGKIGDHQAYSMLKQISEDENERYYTRDSAKRALEFLK